MTLAKEIQLGIEIITEVKHDAYLSAEHDVIRCCEIYFPDDYVESKNIPEKVWTFDDTEPVIMYFQQDQIKRLYELNWFVDIDIGAWCYDC